MKFNYIDRALYQKCDLCLGESHEDAMYGGATIICFECITNLHKEMLARSMVEILSIHVPKEPMPRRRFSKDEIDLSLD